MSRVIDWFHGTPSRLRTTKVSSVVVLSAGVLFVFVASSGLFDGPSAPIRARDSAEIVVQAEVESWEFVFSNKQKPDYEINVVPASIAVGIDNWIIRFKVLRVVKGVLDTDELGILTRSLPNDAGLKVGQRFVLCLNRRSKEPQITGQPSAAYSRGVFSFHLAKTLYQLNREDSRSTYVKRVYRNLR